MISQHLISRRVGCVLKLPQIVGTASRLSGSTNTNDADLAIIGGGIVGAASALEIKKRFPTLQIVILEKEDKLAAHQSGHNSGVIHAGIYYKPGSLKAELCVKGMRMAYDFCDEHNIPYKKVGKLIVAVDHSELAGLEELYRRGRQNGVGMEVVDADGIKQIEPHCTGLRALWSPQTGIVDWARVTREYGRQFERLGGEVRLGAEVTAFGESADPDRPLAVHCRHRPSVHARYVLTCGGLHADRLAALSGCPAEPRVVPFRGEYLVLRPEKSHLVRTNIYPVPDARYPFLGVHFTPRMDGRVWLGPNAVLAAQREGYRWRDVSLRDLAESLRYSGFRQLAWKNVRFGAGEMLRSAFTRLQLSQLRRYVPELTASDIVRGPAGVRAMALSPDGSLVEDFLFDSAAGRRLLHVRNAPSPAATSSLAIAELIADRAQAQFELC